MKSTKIPKLYNEKDVKVIRERAYKRGLREANKLIQKQNEMLEAADDIKKTMSYGKYDKVLSVLAIIVLALVLFSVFFTAQVDATAHL